MCSASSETGIGGWLSIPRRQDSRKRISFSNKLKFRTFAHFIRKKKQGKKKIYNVRSAMKVGRLEEKNSGLEIASFEIQK